MPEPPALIVDAARQRAARIWCEPTTSHIEMDVELAEVFAQALAKEMQEASRWRRTARRIGSYMRYMLDPATGQMITGKIQVGVNTFSAWAHELLEGEPHA